MEVWKYGRTCFGLAFVIGNQPRPSGPKLSESSRLKVS